MNSLTSDYISTYSKYDLLFNKNILNDIFHQPRTGRHARNLDTYSVVICDVDQLFCDISIIIEYLIFIIKSQSIIDVIMQ